jgi:hypothetical protein
MRMTLFLRDVGNFFVHFIFMFVVFSTGLGIVLMLVGLAVGLVLHFVLGNDEFSNSTSALGGLYVGVSLGIIAAFFIAIWGTIKVAPTEASREDFFAQTAQTLGKPNLGRELGYGTEEDEDDEDEGDWYTRTRDRARGEDEDFIMRR